METQSSLRRRVSALEEAVSHIRQLPCLDCGNLHVEEALGLDALEEIARRQRWAPYRGEIARMAREFGMTQEEVIDDLEEQDRWIEGTKARGMSTSQIIAAVAAEYHATPEEIEALAGAFAESAR